MRGGLLLRQIYHWATNVFVAAIAAHLLRIFFTGAFRKPREVNWLIGVTMLTLAIIEGYAGYSLLVLIGASLWTLGDSLGTARSRASPTG